MRRRLYQLRQFFFGNVQNGHRHESRRKLLLLIKDLVIPDIHCELREIVVLLYSQRHSIAPCPISVLQLSRDILILSKKTE